MAHRAAGDSSFDVVLGEGVQRSIDDVDNAKDHQGWRQLKVGIREHLNVETQQGITAHLQQHSCQQHRNRRIGFTVGVRKPGVEREHRQLHAETHQETQITEQAKTAPWRAGCEFAQVERELIA